MASRGLWRLMSARTRRTLTVSWTALFILSLLMQYFAFTVAAPATLAVHDEQFQLDGNAVDDPGTPPDDWANHPGADAFSFIHEGSGVSIFTTGGSKDDLDTNQWRWTNGSVPDKDDLLDGFAALYGDIMYFGADRFANNGDSAVGFWFFQNGLSVNGNGTFSPPHAIGDLFVVSHFENGGAVSEIQLYTWVGSGGSDGALDLTATGQICTGAPANDEACGIANQVDTPAPWAYTPKFGTAGTFPQFSLFEGGLDLSDVFEGDVPCFSSFLVETRSSQEVNAQLKDFIAGDFNTCVPPTITTQVSASTVDFGQSVTDTATLSGSDGPASGTVTFFVCTPAQVTAAGCPSGGSQVGAPVAVTTSANGGTATSSAYTVGTTAAAVGKYCWRAEYAPDAASQYLAGSHTNATTECFTVNPATINITKTADDATVDAGDPIGFTVTVTNTGAGTALGVTVSDPLPAGTGISWSIGTADAGWSITGTAPNQTLVFGPASLAGGASTSAHVVSDTTDDSCGQYTNIASVTTTNNGSDEAGAVTTVANCPVPELAIEKSNDAPIETIDLGDGTSVDVPTAEEGSTVTYTLKYTVVDAVTDATITDVLPAGITYVTGSATSDAQFTFVGFDSATRTLSWSAASVTTGGTLSYKATIDDGAAGLDQPLVNVATIDSRETDPDTDDSQVFVPEPPLELTPPPTDTLRSTDQSDPGLALILVVLGLAGLALAVGFSTPLPARARRRDRLG
jgi:uncharacterized repeat protein (TIGR01451 family)/fimbrial isopeptide formation D2 family protein